ncbi:uncharacterized protein LOC142972927 [Anticarsia gemmatalis]|uniref:uncharacterized protein LOC142972927 n=1 Tax=Anticarsia gemmatalis TaxID=129554 RepID=UPI003F775276
MEDLQNVPTDTCSIEGWTKEEKFYLLQGLKVFKSHDIERIHEYISTKSPEQIVMAINHYKAIAAKHPVFQKRNAERAKKCLKPRVPLSSWAKLLIDNRTLDELKTETSTAIRMIADLESIPPPVCTGNIDFRKLYHTIASAMEGKALTPDKITVAILNKCITETAMASKAFIKNSSYKYVINSIDLSDKEINTFPKPTENQDLSVLRHLASQKCYNPFRIQEHFMKPSCESRLSEDKETHRYFT